MRVTNHAGEDRGAACEMRLGFGFDRDDVRLEYSLIGVVVHLDGFPTVGEPGAPALPRCVVRVALPPHTRLVDVQAEARGTVRVVDEVLPVAPLQPLRPGVIDGPAGPDGPSYGRPGEEEAAGSRRGGTVPRDDDEEEPRVEPYPVPPFVPADPTLYAQATRLPAVSLLETADEGMTPVAVIHLNPVRLSADGFVELSTGIDLALRYESQVDDRRSSVARAAPVTSRAQAMRQIALTRMSVVNRWEVLDYSWLYPVYALGTDYLVVTDNQRWDAAAIAPSGAADGDLVAAFKRLTAWKRQRGLRARVVTLGDIVSGRYGDFRTGSRDLQEVIRRFLKMAHRDWGVAWVLLGGDTEIVPVRLAAGAREGNVNRQAADPPPNATSFWAGDHLRMRVAGGTWWGYGPSPGQRMVRPDTGMLIPYDAAGTSGPTARGWYFTTDPTCAVRSAAATEFVRVNGPAAEVDADVQLLYEWNLIPTDLYYASLVGPGYDQPGRHDWDLLDNGVYGQHSWTGELDGVNYTPTVSVGRAPVRTGAQAGTFVDKVIAYEKFERPDGTLLDPDWTRRVVLVSENWGGRIGIWPGGDPPGDNAYHHATGAGHTLIRLATVPGWDWSLLAYVSEGDERLLPYRTDAAAAGRGWHFAVGPADLSPPRQTVFLPSGVIFHLPLPSQWLVVYAPAQELAPALFVLNHTGLDGSLADQESLREQMRGELPGLREFQRLYEDVHDMTPQQVAAAPLAQLSGARLRTALNAGAHVLSLSGHGSGWGCCRLGHAEADGLTNGYHTFIAYADSCLTNQFEGDSMSEHLLNNPSGGAVAYVGNTRFSWISVGDDVQRRFFGEWATLGGDAHLGLLNDTRASMYNHFYWADGRWSVLALNLMGCPEMPLWWRPPLVFRLPEIVLVDWLRLVIEPPPPDPPILAPYDRNWGLTFVHLRQGEREQVALAGADGAVSMPLADFRPGAATLTVSRPGHVPVVRQVELKGAREEVAGPRHHRLPMILLLLLLLLLVAWVVVALVTG